jgi:hypothetical protein
MAKRKAWAIRDRRGTIHLDKICASKPEAWGLLADDLAGGRPRGDAPTNEEMKASGYECVRVEIRDGVKRR